MLPGATVPSPYEPALWSMSCPPPFVTTVVSIRCRVFLDGIHLLGGSDAAYFSAVLHSLGGDAATFTFFSATLHSFAVRDDAAASSRPRCIPSPSACCCALLGHHSQARSPPSPASSRPFVTSLPHASSHSHSFLPLPHVPSSPPCSMALPHAPSSCPFPMRLPHTRS